MVGGVWLLGLMAGTGSAQPTTDLPQYVHEQWTVEDGLPVNSVNEVIQSRDGYLWLATFDGLVRFDGVQFTVFTAGNVAALPSSRIVELLEAQDGTLWMRTELGHLVRYANGQFVHVEREVGGERVTVLYEDDHGVLWIGTRTGVLTYQHGRVFAVAADELTGEVMRIFRDRADALWVGTAADGLYRWANGVLSRWTVDDGLASNKVRAFLETPDGTLWISSNRGLNTFRDETLRRVPIPGVRDGEEDNIWEVLPGRGPGSFWIVVPQRLYRYEGGRISPFAPPDMPDLPRPSATSPSVSVGPEGHLWVALRNRLYRDGQLVVELGSGIQAFTHDAEGSIWIATHSTGLSRVKPSLFTIYSEPEGLVHKNVYTVVEDHTGAIWAATLQNGLSRLHEGMLTSITTDDGLPSELIYSLYEDRRHRLWVAHGEGVCQWTEGRCVPHNDEQELLHDDPRVMYEDTGGAMWFGMWSGLVRYRAGQWTRFTVADGLPSNDVRVIREGQDGTLWFGTTSGLARFKDGAFRTITSQDGLSSDLVRSLYQDAEGVLWVGTEGRGLNRIDDTGAAPAITTYRSRDGLFDEVIHQILEDDYGRLWMSTNRGIFWVSRKELNAFAEGTVDAIYSTSYTERNGLRNREANGGKQPAGMKSRDGRLWFPTQDGLAVVDPARIQRNERIPPVVIEHVVAGDTAFAPPFGAIQLDARSRDVEIHYTALSYMDPENMRFRYLLEGYDDRWIEAGDRRVAYYTNVAPGTYRFRVIASNNDGLWNERGAMLAFSVRPRFYETTWFIGLCLVVLLAVGPSVFVLRVRHLQAHQEELSRLVAARTAEVVQRESQLAERNEQLEMQAAKLQELNALKSRFFANISHEFRTPLTLIIGPLEDIRAGSRGPLRTELDEQLGFVLRNARRLLRLVNQILDVAKLEAGETRLHARHEDLSDFVSGIAQAFASLAERRQITFDVDVPDDALPAYFDPDLLEKVFVNLLSNAFKFTPSGGTVQVTVRRAAPDPEDTSGHVEMVVRDNGPGIAPDQLPYIFERFYQVDETNRRHQPGSGIGLSLVKELVELHHGTIRVESRLHFGTTFTVVLPLGRAHLDPSQIVTSAPPDSGSGNGIDVSSAALWSAAAETPASALASPSAEPTGPAGEEDDVTTVLVVDDNADVRAYIRSHLRTAYRVVEASDGREALQVARRTLPDLVISDVMMPEMDGHALARALKENHELDYVPVILLTARALPEEKMEGLRTGADDYLTKPFNVEELRVRVDNLIASRRHLRERFAGPRAALHPAEVTVTSSDEAFLNQVKAVIEAHLADEDFSVEQLAVEVGLDRSHLYRRLRDLTGQSPTDTIRSMRLERAAQLLGGGAGMVSEVAYGVGFKSVSHFSKCFRERYGVTPSAYEAQAAPRSDTRA